MLWKGPFAKKQWPGEGSGHPDQPSNVAVGLLLVAILLSFWRTTTLKPSMCWGQSGTRHRSGVPARRPFGRATGASAISACPDTVDDNRISRAARPARIVSASTAGLASKSLAFCSPLNEGTAAPPLKAPLGLRAPGDFQPIIKQAFAPKTSRSPPPYPG